MHRAYPGPYTFAPRPCKRYSPAPQLARARKVGLWSTHLQAPLKNCSLGGNKTTFNSIIFLPWKNKKFLNVSSIYWYIEEQSM